jgi:hypothetical protein
VKPYVYFLGKSLRQHEEAAGGKTGGGKGGGEVSGGGKVEVEEAVGDRGGGACVRGPDKASACASQGTTPSTKRKGEHAPGPAKKPKRSMELESGSVAVVWRVGGGSCGAAGGTGKQQTMLRDGAAGSAPGLQSDKHGVCVCVCLCVCVQMALVPGASTSIFIAGVCGCGWVGGWAGGSHTARRWRGPGPAGPCQASAGPGSGLEIAGEEVDVSISGVSIS